MLRHLLRRLLLAVLVCATVLVISLRPHPASPATRPSPSPARRPVQPDIAAIRTQPTGWTVPCREQFLRLGRPRPPTGDLGRSYLYREPVGDLIARPPADHAHPRLLGLAIALAIALPLGIVAAMNEGTALDRVVMLVAAGRPGAAVLLARRCC